VAVSPTCCLSFEMSVKIITVGFDGPNRAGKATQGALLQKWLDKHGIFSLMIRGAGSRMGQGDQPGDPKSAWWQEVNQRLRTPEVSEETWHITSYRLARELVVWRERILPNLIISQGQELGVLLIDRTLLSRTMILRARQIPDIANNLYPEKARIRGKRISAHLVCPDLILNLIAPAQILIARLVPYDPKYEFRKRLINETSHWFIDAVNFIPEPLQSRVVEIDASWEMSAVFADILSAVQSHFENLRYLD
jgi:thymidylate kinase